MNSAVTELDLASEPAVDLERECEAWDWVRPAGVSAEELREAVRGALGRDES